MEGAGNPPGNKGDEGQFHRAVAWQAGEKLGKWRHYNRGSATFRKLMEGHRESQKVDNLIQISKYYCF